MSSATLTLLRQFASKRVLVTIGISALITALLVWKASTYATDTSRFVGLHAGFVLAAAAFAVANALLAVARWRTILTAVGVRLSYLDCLTIVLAIFPLGLVTPMRASDLLRGVAVRHHTPLSIGIGTVIVEKLVDVPVLFSMAAIGALVLGRASIAIGVVAGAAVIVAGALWLASGRPLPMTVPGFVAKKIDILRTPLQLFLKDRKRVLVTASYSAMGWFCNILVVYALLAATGSTLELARVMSAWPLALLVGLLPITLAGVGTRDAAFLLFSGVPAEQSTQVLTATILYFALTYLMISVVGLGFVPRLVRADPSFGADAATARANRTR